jgi:hypothetical protein
MDNKPTCLNCGNQITKSGRKKFCSTECHREYDRKRKQFCPDCGIKLTTESTYVRGYSSDGQPWLDNYCKSCRIKRNHVAYLKRRTTAGKVTAPTSKPTGEAQKICGSDGYERGTPKTWIKRMLKSPEIFASVFHKPATLENIQKAAVQIGV